MLSNDVAVSLKNFFQLPASKPKDAGMETVEQMLMTVSDRYMEVVIHPVTYAHLPLFTRAEHFSSPSDQRVRH